MKHLFLRGLVLSSGLVCGSAAHAQCESFQEVEVGSPGVAGSLSCNDGVYVLSGAGTGAFDRFTNGNAGDEGHFAYLDVSGDIEIVARVASLSGGPRAQVGLMLRESSAPLAVTAAALVQLGAQASDDADAVNASRRPTGAAWYGTRPPQDAPYWLKLVRVGGNYATYRSSDGARWCPMHDYGGGAFTAPGSFQAGLFVSGGATGASASATIDSVYVGAPRLEHSTSWVGNSASSDAERWVSIVNAMWVHPDGRCVTQAYYDEAGERTHVFDADGTILDALPGNGFTAEGSVTGDEQYVYIASRQGSADAIARVAWDGSTYDPVTLTSSIDHVGGLATGNGELYVTDVEGERILVVSLASLNEVASFPCAPRPGPIAVDSRGDLWIIQRGTDFPNAGKYEATYPAAVRCFHPDGTFSGREITDVVNPSALCIDPNQDRLLVCENGPDQNIRIYTALDTAPAHTSSFGTVGGLFAGGVPGLVNDPGAGGHTRLTGPNGIGIDADGNIYVSCFTIGTDLRKFDPSANLLWQKSAHPFTQCPDFDPTTDGQDLYGVRAHYALDLTQTSPGTEWSFTGQGHNPHGPSGQIDFGFGGALYRRFGPGSQPFLFRVENLSVTTVYRYEGEELIPCGQIGAHTPADRDQWWIDLDGDGLESPEELSAVLQTSGNYSGWRISVDADANGDLYFLHSFDAAWAAGYGYVRHYRMLGLTSEGAPIYGTGAGEYDDTHVPYELVYAHRLRYDQPNDVMYILGAEAGEPSVVGLQLGRWDDWSLPSRSLRYLRSLPGPEEDPNYIFFPPYPSPEGFRFFSLDAVGGMVFLGELWGPIHVYDGALGNEVTRLNPGPEVSGVQGWTDIWHGVRATRRANGEFLVVREDAGIRNRNLLYRWTPEVGAAPAAPANLRAEGASDRIGLRWDGGHGLTAEYAVWRGTQSGGETLLVDGLTAPIYEDASVSGGTSYSYFVTASNSAGTSPPSNEVTSAARTRARFRRIDTETQGDWHGVYGARGRVIIGDSRTFDPDVDFAVTGKEPPREPEVFIFGTPASNHRALQNEANTGRIAATWHGQNLDDPPLITVDLDLGLDGESDVGLYFLDWDTSNRRSARIDVRDGLGRLLDSRVMSSYRPGHYAIWQMSGHVRIELTDVGGFGLGISGLFVDPSHLPPRHDTGGTTPPAAPKRTVP